MEFAAVSPRRMESLRNQKGQNQGLERKDSPYDGFKPLLLRSAAIFMGRYL